SPVSYVCLLRVSPPPVLSTLSLHDALPIFGATVVVMEQFDPVRALEYIERYRITHSQWVPTMFVRMWKLTDEERNRYDLSSHKRSEEHTSELSHVAISYAVFCLKKNKLSTL